MMRDRLLNASRTRAMKSLLFCALMALAACQNPMFATDLTFGSGGVSLNPTLSGEVGNATVTLNP